MKKAIIFWIHLILIILAWTSPFWLSWKIIIFFIVLMYIQVIIFKGCILTIAQFNKDKEKKMTMYTFILEKMGFKVNRMFIKRLSRFVFPIIIIIVSLIWQVLLNNQVFLHF